MLGGILKLTLFLNVLFVFIIVFWQATTVNASPILANNENLVESNEDVPNLSVDNNHKGANIVKRSLHTTIDQQPLIDNSHARSRTRHRRLRKKFHSSKLKNSPHLFKSAGLYDEFPRASKRIQAVVDDDRLKRFRMLDPDEFQEMLSSFNQHHIPDDQSKAFNSMDTIGGMQLENYWSRK